MRLERDDFRVLLQHGVGVKLLIRFHRLDVDVDPVAQAEHRALVGRLGVPRRQREADVEMCGRIGAGGMEV